MVVLGGWLDLLISLNDAMILNESLEVLLLSWGGSSGSGVGCMQVLMFLCCCSVSFYISTVYAYLK